MFLGLLVAWPVPEQRTARGPSEFFYCLQDSGWCVCVYVCYIKTKVFLFADRSAPWFSLPGAAYVYIHTLAHGVITTNTALFK